LAAKRCKVRLRVVEMLPAVLFLDLTPFEKAVAQDQQVAM